jgi:hypothetical protein
MFGGHLRVQEKVWHDIATIVARKEGADAKAKRQYEREILA